MLVNVASNLKLTLPVPYPPATQKRNADKSTCRPAPAASTSATEQLPLVPNLPVLNTSDDSSHSMESEVEEETDQGSDDDAGSASGTGMETNEDFEVE